MADSAGGCGCRADGPCTDIVPGAADARVCNPCALAASGILVCNNGVQESIPTPPNTGGPWTLVFRTDTTPPGYDWMNAGGLSAAKKTSVSSADAPAMPPMRLPVSAAMPSITGDWKAWAGFAAALLLALVLALLTGRPIVIPNPPPAPVVELKAKG